MSNILMGPSRHQCNWSAEHCDLCEQRSKYEAEHSTDPQRPDVEGILKDWGTETGGALCPGIESLCNYALDVEKRMKIAETDRVAMKEINQECYNTLRSLLADLVKAVEENNKSYLTDNYRSGRLRVKNAKVQAYKKLTDALTAAKQHLKAAKTVLTKKKRE